MGGLDFVLRGVILSRFPLRERWWGCGVVRGEGDWDSVVHVRWRGREAREGITFAQWFGISWGLDGWAFVRESWRLAWE